MNRELVRCSEGYWKLIDETGHLVCRFKIGDKVRMTNVTPPCYDWEFIEGTVFSIEYLDIYPVINIKNLFHKEAVDIEDIWQMEVIE